MREMYERLAEKQRPDALFITCGDSRIDPSLLTGTEPGELFVERTPGNIVPVYDDDVDVGVSASIEYAVEVLGVKNIIVCGHSACGAMKALLHPEHLQHLPATARWLKFAQPALREFRRENTNKAENLNRLTQINVLEQCVFELCTWRVAFNLRISPVQSIWSRSAKWITSLTQISILKLLKIKKFKNADGNQCQSVLSECVDAHTTETIPRS